MKEISGAVQINMFHPKEQEELLNLEEKTKLIKNNKFGINHWCNSNETRILQEMIQNNEAFVSHFETGSTVQTSGYDALIVCKNKEYFLVKWKNQKNNLLI